MEDETVVVASPALADGATLEDDVVDTTRHERVRDGQSRRPGTDDDDGTITLGVHHPLRTAIVDSQQTPGDT